jgi:Heterokaryon incompatibility protein (HET)
MSSPHYDSVLSNPGAATNEGLCKECAQINFEEILNPLGGINGRSRRTVAQFGRRLDRGKESACLLCRVFWTVRLPAEHSSEYDLQAFSALRNYPGIHYGRAPKSLRQNDCLFLAVVPKLRPLNHVKSVLDWGWRAGYISRAFPSQDINSDHFCAQIVPAYLDYSILREWLSFCQQNHITCKRQETQPLEGLRLIDCDTLFIVQATSSSLYIALSYVWCHAGGNTSQARSLPVTLLQAKPVDRLLPRNLSKVIKDSITVARELGIRFLWVDKYCIDQGNAIEKHDQINKMDVIYRRAQVTIIAASGKGENSGLPGISNMPRTLQPLAKVGNITIVSTMGHPAHSIKQSRWSSRAWTYQEAVLSRRRLVFTDNQVYYECDAMNCYESLHLPLSCLHTNNKKSFGHFARSGIFDGSDKVPFCRFDSGSKKSLSHIWTHIENYTARSLTYDSDSINALLGVLQDFRNPIYHHWGLPFIRGADGAASRSLEVSLRWKHGDKGASRRPAFPSWSWAGWEGEVSPRKRNTVSFRNHPMHFIPTQNFLSS